MYHYQPRFYRVQPSVVAFARGDVTGDGVVDDVYLTGVMASEGPFTQQITLVVRHGRTGASSSVPLRENTGYHPTLFLGDFTGNGVNDILIRIATGGSGAITNDYVYSYVNSRAQLLFDSQVYNEQYEYDVEYQDHYKVNVISKANRQKYVIDISTTRDAAYLNEIYTGNGQLKNPITGFVNPLSGLYPVDFDSNGVYELLAYQRIAGRYNADGLGFVLNTLGWQGNRFALENQYVAIMGSTI